MPVVTPPDIDTLPPAPIRGQAGFSTATGVFLEALPDWGDQIDEAGQATKANADYVAQLASDIEADATVANNAAGLVGKMSGSLTVSAGTKAITLVTAKPELAVANKQVGIVLDSDNTIVMFGTIASSPAPTTTTFSVTVTSGGILAGSGGTFSGWKIIDAAFFDKAATAAEIWAGTTDQAAITPKGRADAAAPVAVSYASTLALDMNSGRYRYMASCSASFTLGIPTNAKAGDWFVLDLLNSAGSIVLAANAAWDWRGGLLGVLNPDNAARNKIVGIIDEVDGSGNMTRGTAFVIAGLA